MDLQFIALEERRPAALWAKHFARVGPHYEAWYFADGDAPRPTYLACSAAMNRYMPELVPLWNELVVIGGGGDRAARMLSQYRPPAFMAGCSQVLWARDEAALVRNYDYEVDLCEGLLLHSAWCGHSVIASVDSLWGALDGMNAHGVAVSLAFGGRKTVGDGFGIPVIVRYVLETCRNTAEAVAALSRVPCHMCYSVGVIDRSGAFATVYLNPDRPAFVAQEAVTTNHQGVVEWPEHAAITHSVERYTHLDQLQKDPAQTLESTIGSFLEPPLRSMDRKARFATLYTAVYRPETGQVELRWPTITWHLSFAQFVAQVARISL
jgi:predicted choloylglycine hydrolase